MSHFARVDEKNVVVEVLVVPQEREADGEEFLSNELGLGGTWLRCSYTSVGGNRRNPDTGEIVAYGDHFRFNYPGEGFTFHPELGPDGGFVPPKRYPSWTLNPDTALWDAPTPVPSEDGFWIWDEASLSWIQI